MADQPPTPDPTELEAKLNTALGEFRTKADQLIADLSKGKQDLLDGAEGKPSMLQQLTKASEDVKAAVEAIRRFHASLHDPATEGGKAVIDEVPEAIQAVTDAKKRIDQFEADIKAYQESLLGKKEGEKEVPGIKQEVEGKVNDITELHSKVYDKKGDQAPVAQAINEFVDELGRKKGEFEAIKKEVEGYEDTLFGPKSEEGQRKDGIKGQVEGYLKDLRGVVINSKATQERIRKQAEDMLQDAATASLAEDSIKQKKSFVLINTLWMVALFVAIGMLIWSPFIDFSEVLSLHTVSSAETPASNEGADSAALRVAPSVTTVTNTSPAAPSIPWYVHWLMRLPFVGGAIWLGWYAGKQRSQNKRLQQEYAHKENVAKLYYSLKREIEELEKGGDNARLARILKVRVMRVLVNSMGYNPSVTLDSRSHDDNGPMQKGYDKALDSVKGVAEAIAKVKIK